MTIPIDHLHNFYELSIFQDSYSVFILDVKENDELFCIVVNYLREDGKFLEDLVYSERELKETYVSEIDLTLGMQKNFLYGLFK